MMGSLIEDSVLFQIEHGRIPFALEIGRHAFAHGLVESEIQAICHWLEEWDLSKFKEKGRSFFYKLERPIICGDRVYPILKLKGTVFQGQPPKMMPYANSFQAAAGSPYSFSAQPQRSIEVLPNGTIKVRPRKHVTGCQFLEDALREYHSSKHILNEGFDCLYPIGVGNYTDLNFEGAQVGFTVLGCPNMEDYRPGQYFSKVCYENQKNFPVIMAAMQNFSEWYPKAGELLRSVNEKLILPGFPHINNFVIDKDRLFFCDLDVCYLPKDLNKEQFVAYMYIIFNRLFSTILLTLHPIGIDDYVRGCNAQGILPITRAFLKGYFRSLNYSFKDIFEAFDEKKFMEYRRRLSFIDGITVQDIAMRNPSEGMAIVLAMADYFWNARKIW